MFCVQRSINFFPSSKQSPNLVPVVSTPEPKQKLQQNLRKSQQNFKTPQLFSLLEPDPEDGNAVRRSLKIDKLNTDENNLQTLYKETKLN